MENVWKPILVGMTSPISEIITPFQIWPKFPGGVKNKINSIESCKKRLM